MSALYVAMETAAVPSGGEVPGGDHEDGGPGEPVEFLRVVRAGRAEFDRAVLTVQVETVQLPQDTARPGGSGRRLDGGEFGHGRRRDVQEFSRDGLALGDTDAAHHVHGLAGLRAEQRGDRGRSSVDGALDGLPCLVGVASHPAVLCGGDGHAHPGRGDGRAHTTASLKPSFEFELLQRLAERGPGDTEARSEVPLVGQNLSDREVRVECLTEHGLEVPVLRLLHRFQLRGPHPVLRIRRWLVFRDVIY